MREVEILGGKAQVREAEDLTPRQKRRLRDAVSAAGPAIVRLQSRGLEGVVADSVLSAADVRRLRELQEATACVQLVSWDREEPLPTEETIGDLDTELYDSLIAAIGAIPATDDSLDFSVNPDPKAPTDAPGDSSGRSSDEPESPSQATSQSDGSPSSTDSSSPG